MNCGTRKENYELCVLDLTAMYCQEHLKLCVMTNTNMAASVVFPDPSSKQVSYKEDLHCVQKHFSCIDLESQ